MGRLILRPAAYLASISERPDWRTLGENNTNEFVNNEWLNECGRTDERTDDERMTGKLNE